jgi:hypothetical protein
MVPFVKMAEEPVRSEPFSAGNSLHQGKIQGIIAFTTSYIQVILQKMPVLCSY